MDCLPDAFHSKPRWPTSSDFRGAPLSLRCSGDRSLLRYSVDTMRFCSMLGLALAFACGPSALQAQTAREDVSAQLKVVTDTKADAGYLPDQQALGRSVLLGVLEHDSNVYLEAVLDAGRDYYIAAR